MKITISLQYEMPLSSNDQFEQNVRSSSSDLTAQHRWRYKNNVTFGHQLLNSRYVIKMREQNWIHFSIAFPAHFCYLFIQFHPFSIQFRPKKLTAFKSKVKFRQIVIHIRFLSMKFNNSAFKFVNCHWNSSQSLRELRMQGSNSSFFQTNSLFCHSNSSDVIGPLHLGDDFEWNFDEN